jgi:hypothetical protein
MTSEGPNHDLFVKVLAQIEREPERWEQSTYSHNGDCGTAYCFAGWAATLTGGKWVSSTTLVPQREDAGKPVYSEIACWPGSTTAWDRAIRVLGIDFKDAFGERGLFEGGNTLNDLYRLSADILGIDEQVLRDKVAAEVSS